VLHLAEAREIEVGRLGTLAFQDGYYVYIGSAARRLGARMARHRRYRKKLHWHIDWLRQHAAFVAALPVRTKEDLECALAKAIAPLAAWQVPDFGSSDCACPSHLFGWKENPLVRRDFVETLLDFRIGRVSARIEVSFGVAGATCSF
jgi:sugar fermentation stimulation protein A